MTGGALARAGLTVTGAFFVSRVLGWFRVIVLGNLFGAGSELDAYYAAFRIPDLMFQLVAAGAVASALVPVLSGLIATGERSRAWRVASTVTDLLLVALLVLSLVMFALAPALVPYLVPGFDVATTALTVSLTRLMLLSPIFLAAGAIASAILNVEGRFGAAALAPVLYNACIIGGALLLGGALGVYGAALGVVVGSVVHLGVQLPTLRRHFHFSPRPQMADPAARRALLLMAPRAVGLGANQITFLVNTALATSVGVGAVVAYNVAFNVLQIPLGVVGLPLGIVLLPSLSRALALGEQEHFGHLVVNALRLLLWASFFLAAVGIVTRDELIDLLFGWGFDEEAIAATAATLGVFLLGLPAHALNVILARAFYSDQDTITPVSVAVASVGVNVAVSLSSVSTLGLQGLALGIALGGWFEAGVLSWLLHRRVASVRLRSVVVGGVTALTGAIVAAAVAALAMALLAGLTTSGGVVGLLVAVTLATASAGVVYLLYSRLVRLPELPRALSLMRSAFRPG